MAPTSKIRLDELVLQRKLAHDIREAQAIILSGKIVVDEERIDKVGTLVGADVSIRKKMKCPFVSRGGFKLQQALDFFNIDPTEFVCIDVGASSGGFSDCLLQHHAKKIYAVDVAYGQLDWKIRQDPRVVVIERFNARNISTTQVPDQIDLAVIDASFISLTKLVLPLLPLFKTPSIVGLIKPQFELPKEDIGPNGVVRDKRLHEKAIEKIQVFCDNNDLNMSPTTTSPILGPKGNKEFLVHITTQ